LNTIIGQTKLVAQLLGYTFETVPSTLLLLGESGCGKTLVAHKLAKHLGLDVITLTSQTTAEELLEYSQAAVPALYHIDLSQISEKAQNKFLKFIEEPTATVKVVLEAESEVGILPTILNRCNKLTFDSYTQEELQSFSWAPKAAVPLFYYFCNTPGKLNEIGSPDNFFELVNYCKYIITKLPTMNVLQYAEGIALSLPLQVKKNKTSKFDCDLFLKVLAYTAFEDFKQTKSDSSFKIYLCTIRQRQQLINRTYTKNTFILNFFNQLWEVSHDATRA
jgi:tRNA A37 threonylcarbamoyladenosine biosynthesis protein TsaE